MLSMSKPVGQSVSLSKYGKKKKEKKITNLDVKSLVIGRNNLSQLYFRFP